MLNLWDIMDMKNIKKGIIVEYINYIISKNNNNELHLSSYGITNIDFAHYNINKFSYLNMKKNVITTIKNIPINIISLNVSYNLLTHVNFLHPSLVILNLSFNNLIINEDTFINTPKIIILDLSYTKLSIIPKNLFKNLTSLKKLILSNNNIDDIDNVYFPPTLQYLNISNNKLNNPNLSRLDYISNLVII